jgi:hypothetical protein
MREVVYAMIAGNPYIKTEDKPGKDQIIELSIDRKEEKKKEKVITPEELETIRQRMLKMIK